MEPTAPVPPPGPPITFSVDYPDRPLDRLTTALRVFWLIPIGFVLATVNGPAARSWTSYGGDTTTVVVGAGGLLFFGPLLLILFRRKYPRWWFDWNLQLLRFENRVAVYAYLLRDEYPSTDEEQAVHLELRYPDVPRELNRWLPLVKWLLAVPHYIVLFFLWIGVVVAVVVAWFAILFTGRYPRGLFDYVVGVLRWSNRVAGYALLLVTDAYPPFRLAP